MSTVLSHFDVPVAAEGSIKAKCKHCLQLETPSEKTSVRNDTQTTKPGTNQQQTIQSFVVQPTKRVRGRHTSENIHQQVITSFNITHKISHIITDNASKVIKAFNFEHNNDSDENTDNGSDEDELSTQHP
ncbi:hypothetical protein LSH36_2003g00010 [Paralvinella palmiformis]|uniref:Uncharacterized protein n=1 Tax=Paralvinella palmiformis TaxID=53620 RepID=A0AAD9IRN6_9ANNE|nr:hypothetical protein LSH36_2003g00010 [Paralvinella palmiformis]